MSRLQPANAGDALAPGQARRRPTIPPSCRKAAYEKDAGGELRNLSAKGGHSLHALRVFEHEGGSCSLAWSTNPEAFKDDVQLAAAPHPGASGSLPIKCPIALKRVPQGVSISQQGMAGMLACGALQFSSKLTSGALLFSVLLHQGGGLLPSFLLPRVGQFFSSWSWGYKETSKRMQEKAGQRAATAAVAPARIPIADMSAMLDPLVRPQLGANMRHPGMQGRDHGMAEISLLPMHGTYCCAIPQTPPSLRRAGMHDPAARPHDSMQRLTLCAFFRA